MAGREYRATTEGSIAAPGTSAVTVLGVEAPATNKCEILSATVSFGGTVATNARVRVRFYRTAAGGTGTGVNEEKVVADESLAAGAAAKKTYTVEPSSKVVLDEVFVPPTQGFTWRPPKPLFLKESGCFGIEVLEAGGVPPTVASINWNE
jgi:hypothetical protein